MTDQILFDQSEQTYKPLSRLKMSLAKESETNANEPELIAQFNKHI